MYLPSCLFSFATAGPQALAQRSWIPREPPRAGRPHAPKRCLSKLLSNAALAVSKPLCSTALLTVGAFAMLEKTKRQLRVCDARPAIRSKLAASVAGLLATSASVRITASRLKPRLLVRTWVLARGEASRNRSDYRANLAMRNSRGARRRSTRAAAEAALFRPAGVRKVRSARIRNLSDHFGPRLRYLYPNCPIVWSWANGRECRAIGDVSAYFDETRVAYDAWMTRV